MSGGTGCSGKYIMKYSVAWDSFCVKQGVGERGYMASWFSISAEPSMRNSKCDRPLPPRCHLAAA